MASSNKYIMNATIAGNLKYHCTRFGVNIAIFKSAVIAVS